MSNLVVVLVIPTSSAACNHMPKQKKTDMLSLFLFTLDEVQGVSKNMYKQSCLFTNNKQTLPSFYC